MKELIDERKKVSAFGGKVLSSFTHLSKNGAQMMMNIAMAKF